METINRQVCPKCNTPHYGNVLVNRCTRCNARMTEPIPGLVWCPKCDGDGLLVSEGNAMPCDRCDGMGFLVESEKKLQSQGQCDLIDLYRRVDE